MSPQRRPIFRQRAMQHYIQKKEKDILPRFTSPLLLTWLWLFLLQISLLGLLIFTIPLPSYTTIPGVILPAASSGHGQTTVALFVPQQMKQAMHIGETIALTLHSGDAQKQAKIVAIAPNISQPEDIQRQFALKADSATTLTTPVRVVQVTLTTVTAPTKGSEVLAQLQTALNRSSQFNLQDPTWR
ncbi:hypothetical protein [Dictyobacter kobayashii]|uniref:Membrane fusion protein biotin-lipoyl like domain-containing protein n=1 Tax=Dictyobacter kobayashii TaxID=2014872 RepID=A0A402AP32_9CHLR|nr:hypothetical protein [Dictyobacter kobayashii]GCE20730.1 hypothetical protein KDK_45300 [Dictyobacter kobayashii]